MRDLSEVIIRGKKKLKLKTEFTSDGMVIYYYVDKNKKRQGIQRAYDLDTKFERTRIYYKNGIAYKAIYFNIANEKRVISIIEYYHNNAYLYKRITCEFDTKNYVSSIKIWNTVGGVKLYEEYKFNKKKKKPWLYSVSTPKSHTTYKTFYDNGKLRYINTKKYDKCFYKSGNLSKYKSRKLVIEYTSKGKIKYFRDMRRSNYRISYFNNKRSMSISIDDSKNWYMIRLKRYAENLNKLVRITGCNVLLKKSTYLTYNTINGIRLNTKGEITKSYKRNKNKIESNILNFNLKIKQFKLPNFFKKQLIFR